MNKMKSAFLTVMASLLTVFAIVLLVKGNDQAFWRVLFAACFANIGSYCVDIIDKLEDNQK